MSTKKLHVPARMTVHYIKKNSITIRVNNPKMDIHHVRKLFREKCRQHPNYFLPIDNGGVNGKNEDKTPIPINVLGKWVFGTPGYMANIIINLYKSKLIIYFDPETPAEAMEMLKSVESI